ncbi:DEAD/DEAH box helicase [Candidatus Bathyarchaeota archaeon]|nr:DEAD/DEAH box helicase [Candidatus Bathyarchaeota archaeon]
MKRPMIDLMAEEMQEIQQTEENNTFNLLVRPIRKLIAEKGFKSPTEPQAKVIPKILEGKNVLLISPTASGKTEAAVLPILNMLIQMPRREPGIKVLYVTPLRALNRDMLERLEWWCNNLDIKLAVRHGDTDTRERTRQARSPPDMLITTPETLQSILSGWIMRRHLQSIRWVVVDEVHELADSKRGSQLALALERLRTLVGRDFQIIGLSATIGTPEKVAQFLVGNNRPIEVVRVPVARTMRLQILYPKPETQDHELASMLFTHPEVAARLRIMRQLIEEHNSVLLFTNTRTISEVLASRFKIWDVNFPVSIHHGSLAKPSRIAAERGLKRGELRGLVCTSSLELGIDVGRIDLVIQYMSPRQVTRLIQRVGRSGHRIGRMAKGVIITMDSDDTLEAMVIGRKAYNEELEPVDIPEKPFDVLAHQIAALLMKRKRLQFDEIYEIYRKAYPYRNLTIEDIERVLEYMHSRFPRLAWVSFEDKVVLKPRRSKALYEYFFENLSMIPDEKHYLVIDKDTDTAVGLLDEAFVAEYGKPGIKFIIRGSPWKIVNMDADKIYVKPVDDPTGAIPSWVGEEIPVPFEVAQEVGAIRAFVEEKMKVGLRPEDIAKELSERYPADEKTILDAIAETVEHIERGYLPPTDKRITIEEWEDFIILQCNFGSLTNRALAQILGHILSELTGYSVIVQHDPYRIFIQTMGEIRAETIIKVLLELRDAAEDFIREELTRAVVKTGIFKRRMIHVARRFGAIQKWVDFESVSLRNLIKSFEDTVIYEEALKEVFTKDLDLKNLINVLKMMRNGEIEIVEVETDGEATPIARVGIERVSMKTDLIPPEKMRRILIESAKVRLLNETRTFVCTECWGYMEMLAIKDLPDRPVCPRCGSSKLGLLKIEEDKAYSLVEKRGEKLTKSEERLKKEATETANLISKYGKVAAIALSGKKLRLSDVRKILSKESRLTNKFFELIIEAEREALKRRFW